jgi:NAD(P)H dehydrogenase (quinone)
MPTSETIVITGATGHLGRLTIAELLHRAPAAHIIGLVRNPAAAQDLVARGVELRKADYNDPAALTAALAGADKVLLVSSSEVGQRLAQHRNVIDAAKTAGVKLLAYTSVLRADTSPLSLAIEHRATEEYLRTAGVPAVVLRNGWYTENYTDNIASVLQHNALLGSARDGRISAAARADFAAAAAVVLADDPLRHVGKMYELAGDNAFTLAEYASEVARQTGRPIVYRDLPEAEYEAVLQQAGVPEAFAHVFAESDAHAAEGCLYDGDRVLSRLIGRPTTPLVETVTQALVAGR